MPSVDENLKVWDSYPWSDRGEEWSQPWGNAALQWAITIYPRIMRAIPTDTILEIAPGFGRWVPFLLAYSRSYIGIDISPRCISYCQDVYGRLRQRPRFSVGDGTSFPGVENSNVSFIFSFDSLVHVELDCLSAYMKEINRVLRPGGYAFLHHSNLGAYEVGSVDNQGWRGVTVSAERFAHECVDAGLRVVTQEKTPWVFGGILTDCFSLLQKPGRGEKLDFGRLFVNEDFHLEFKIAAKMAERA
jgi:SAM-dependent methyltransferase